MFGFRVNDARGTTVWECFLSGLKHQSLASLSLAAVIATLACYFAASTITEQWMAQNGSLFAMGEHDVQAHVTQEALVLKHSGADGDLLTIAGHLESIRFIRDDWNRLDPSIGGSGPEIVDLRTPFQTIYESFALFDQVPWSACRKAIVVVVPAMFCREANAHSEMEDRSKLGVRSVAAMVESIRMGAPAAPLRGNYFIDNQSYLISRAPYLVRNYFGQKLGWQTLRVESMVQPEYRREVATMEHAVVQTNTYSFDRLLQRLSFRGFQVVVVVFKAEPPDTDSDLRWRLQTIAESCGAQFRVLLPTEVTIAGIPREVLMDLMEQAR